MVGELMYAFRVMRLPLLDAGGGAIGKIDDIVVVPGRALEAPRVLGFVVSSQRRRIFVSTSRIATVDNEGVRLKSWDVDLNPFHPRPGERLSRREREKNGGDSGNEAGDPSDPMASHPILHFPRERERCGRTLDGALRSNAG